jgi:hypothetical protein
MFRDFGEKYIINLVLHSGGMIVIVLWDRRPARRRVFLQQAGRLTPTPHKNHPQIVQRPVS